MNFSTHLPCFIQLYTPHSKKYETADKYNFVCGTSVYEDYPTREEYFANFGPWTMADESAKDKYYRHLPVDCAGNIYLGGAKATSKEKDAVVDDRKVSIEVRDESQKAKSLIVSTLPGMEIDVSFEP